MRKRGTSQYLYVEYKSFETLHSYTYEQQKEEYIRTMNRVYISLSAYYEYYMLLLGFGPVMNHAICRYSLPKAGIGMLTPNTNYMRVF